MEVGLLCLGCHEAFDLLAGLFEGGEGCDVLVDPFEDAEVGWAEEDIGVGEEGGRGRRGGRRAGG